MRTIAFVGPSGTGKSHRCMSVARKNHADAVIDDGLLISGNKVIAGISAKRETTKIASVKCALFMKDGHAEEVKKAIRENNTECVMILGTSDGMVERIAQRLELPPISRYIRITDVATAEEMNRARNMRTNEGKHVIPVSTFEIKKDFSGYFLHPLKIFQKNMGRYDIHEEDNKSIVRPTFSYMGDFEISDRVLGLIAVHEASRIDGVVKVNMVNVREGGHGAHIDMTVTLKYGYDIRRLCRKIQRTVKNGIEYNTSVNARQVHIYVRGLSRW
ncbi:MAG: Asp23/Gls24 family envelope stress response protein [Oscillospiraceae bacterium]|nr:Asp23/Gls24 family envelope stress response protein [Oscillospiraceae bacterium]